LLVASSQKASSNPLAFSAGRGNLPEIPRMPSLKHLNLPRISQQRRLDAAARGLRIISSPHHRARVGNALGGCARGTHVAESERRHDDPLAGVKTRKPLPYTPSGVGRKTTPVKISGNYLAEESWDWATSR
jgi:hypothetical protein